MFTTKRKNAKKSAKSVKGILKRSLTACLALIACVNIYPVTKKASAATYYVAHPKEGDYYICASDNNNACIDVTGGSTAQGTYVQLWERSAGNNAQIFTIKHVSGDWYKIVNRRSSLCINLSGGNSHNGARLHMWPWDNTDSCLFRFFDAGNGNYIIQNKVGSQRVIDLDNNLCRTNGSRIHVWDFHSGASAKWKLISAGSTSTATTTASSSSSNSSATHAAYVNTNSANLILRSSPSTSGSRIASMPKGSSVTVLDNKRVYNNSFYRVTYNGKTGYCSKSYIAFGQKLSTVISPSNIVNTTTVIGPSTINNNSSKLLFPLKGSITRSSSVRTNGYYCDYRTGGSVALYAPANGTVTYYQTYAYRNGTNKLVSYGNWIEFRSSDGKYVIKMAHLDSFNSAYINRSSLIPSYNSERISASNVSCTTKTVGSAAVSQGAFLGYSGKTGNASGHHLHLEVKQNGRAVNPTSVFTKW